MWILFDILSYGIEWDNFFVNFKFFVLLISGKSLWYIISVKYCVRVVVDIFYIYFGWKGVWINVCSIFYEN